MRQALRLPPGPRATAAVASRQRPYPPWFAAVCLAALATGIVAAFLVALRVPPQDNAEPPAAVRAVPGTSTAWQASASDSTDPLPAPADPAAGPGGDVVAEQSTSAARTTVPLDPDDASFLREDGAGSHIGEPLDPDGGSSLSASGEVSHIGYPLHLSDD